MIVTKSRSSEKEEEELAMGEDTMVILQVKGPHHSPGSAGERGGSG